MKEIEIFVNNILDRYVFKLCTDVDVTLIKFGYFDCVSCEFGKFESYMLLSVIDVTHAQKM